MRKMAGGKALLGIRKSHVGKDNLTDVRLGYKNIGCVGLEKKLEEIMGERILKPAKACVFSIRFVRQ